MVNRNRNQVHAYNPDESERLRRVTLPSKLKCDMCQKNYNAANFSERQKDDVRWQILHTGRISTNPKCLKCTGGHVVEMECTMCHKTKGLEEFAKAQRKKPDDARCYSCTDAQLAREPVDEERYNDPTRAFITTQSSSGRAPEYWSSTFSARDTESSNGDWPETESTNEGRRRQESGGIDLSTRFQQAVSLGGEVSDTLIDSEFSFRPDHAARPGARSEVASTGSWHTAAENASTGRATGSSNGYGRPSTRSGAASSYSFNSNLAERSQSGGDRIEMRNGFAKIPACPPPQLEEEDDFSDRERPDSDDEDNDDDAEI